MGGGVMQLKFIGNWELEMEFGAGQLLVYAESDRERHREGRYVLPPLGSTDERRQASSVGQL